MDFLFIVSIIEFILSLEIVELSFMHDLFSTSNNDMLWYSMWWRWGALQVASTSTYEFVWWWWCGSF